MKASDAFPSNYLKAADLQGNRVNVIIESVAVEDLNDDRKPVVKFRGKEKQLVLNRTNFNRIVDLVGEDDTDNWHGRAISLYPTTTEFQGKTVPCLRVAEATDTPAPPPEEILPPDVTSVPF